MSLDFFGVYTDIAIMNRYLTKYMKSRLGRKILLLSGPRQVGKTFLARSIIPQHAYYNYDIKKDIRVFRDQEFDSQEPLVIFDEIHKMRKWKLWLKGLYDEGRFQKQSVIVTGSARLEAMKKVGDSLAGRYLSFRLNPLDMKELRSTDAPEAIYKTLIERGGFPEPYLAKDADFHRIWRRTHTDIILRQDLISLEVVRDLNTLELLMELLATRVGSPISMKSLSEDLQVDDKTVKRWLTLLENLYVVFRVQPLSKNIPRGIQKASKYYFYDTGRVEGDESQKLENLVALGLRKELDLLEDTKGYRTKLHFLKTKEQKEVDFCVQIEKCDPLLIEVKLSDDHISKSILQFAKWFPKAQKYQWVKNISKNYSTKEGVHVENALTALTNLKLGPGE